MIAETILSAVSAAGLGIAAITAYRKRFLAATRIAAYSLVPVGLVMTGAVSWLAHTAFSPVAWAGFLVLALAWLLFMTTRAVERRSGMTRKERRRAAKEAKEREAVEPRASEPSLGATARPTAEALTAAKPRTARDGGQRQAQGGDDFSDIEAILKKHGI